MSRLRRKIKTADGASPYSMMDAPSGGYFYNYESDVEPELLPGVKQFNTLDREENYWLSDQPMDNSEWRFQQEMGASVNVKKRLNAKPSSEKL